MPSRKILIRSKAVKSADGKAAKKQAKKALKDAIAYNENIEISKW